MQPHSRYGVFTPIEVVIFSHLRLEIGGVVAGGGGGFVAFTGMNSMTSARTEIRGTEYRMK